MLELLPALLVHDETVFFERIQLMESVATTIHLDIMDGVFVPQATWFDADVLRQLKTPLRFELHLMVRDPERIINQTKGISSIIRTLWHVEAETDHHQLIQTCRAERQEAGLAISPQTPLERLSPFIRDMDEVLIMGNEPGFSGQNLQPHALERAREVHTSFPFLCLGFDIGVNFQTASLLKQVGVSRFCAASAIFGSVDPQRAFEALQKIVKE